MDEDLEKEEEVELEPKIGKLKKLDDADELIDDTEDLLAVDPAIDDEILSIDQLADEEDAEEDEFAEEEW